MSDILIWNQVNMCHPCQCIRIWSEQFSLVQVEIRPMMYVALTYDHRLIDGREAVTFLRKIKSVVEDPRVLLLDM